MIAKALLILLALDATATPSRAVSVPFGSLIACEYTADRMNRDRSDHYSKMFCVPVPQYGKVGAR